MRRYRPLLVGDGIMAILGGVPATAQLVTRPVVVDDNIWCARMLPGSSLADARGRCNRFLGHIWAIEPR